MIIALYGSKFSGRSTIAQYLAEHHKFIIVSKTGDFPEGLALWDKDIRVVISHIDAKCEHVLTLLKRPYFLLVYVTTSLLRRFDRALSCNAINADTTLHDFVLQYGDGDLSATLLARNARERVRNDFSTISLLHNHLFELQLTNPDRLRPPWDSYFMALAKLAAQRTNCMKRRVGCVIARDRRVVATGYNGTPSGVTNCCDGGCIRCNADTAKGAALDLCLCLHAEENAIIEAGRDRCYGSTLYTTLFPCVLCAKKIVQSGIRRVVFDSLYTSDDAARSLMKAGDVEADAHAELAPLSVAC